MKLVSKSFLFCLLLKQVIANGCELATRDRQYLRITCKLPQNFTLFDEQEFPKNHFQCSQGAELWVVCGDGQLRDMIKGGITQGRDMLDVFPNHLPTIDTRLGSTKEFLKLIQIILEQNSMLEESEERNQSPPISINDTISEEFIANAATDDFTVIVNGYAFYSILIGFGILLLTSWTILAVIVVKNQCKT